MGKQHRRFTVFAMVALLGALLFFPLPLTLSPFVQSVRAARNDAALVSTNTREGRLAVFDDAWARINDRYYDQKFHGLDWDAQRTTLRSFAASADSSQELYAVLRRMIAPLNDPHTRVFSPEEKFDWWRPRYVSVGFAVAEVGGLPTVVKVDPESMARRTDLRIGDVIETVDGEPSQTVIQKRLKSLPGTPGASSRFRVFAKLLDGPADTPVEVSWKSKDGKRKSARFVRYWQQRELGMRIRREQGKYAVIELDAFTKPIAATFARALKDLGSVSGIILDLRSNGGGDAEAMTDVASSFLGIGSSLGRFTDREGAAFTITTHYKSLFTPETLAQTKVPLVVLTSARTASAAEIFVEALRVSRRATIIGAETCGCVLAVRTRHVLPDGGLLDVSEMDYETAAGNHLEGHGIDPDETVLIERNDLYARRDRALELAVVKLAGLQD